MYLIFVLYMHGIWLGLKMVWLCIELGMPLMWCRLFLIIWTLYNIWHKGYLVPVTWYTLYSLKFLCSLNNQNNVGLCRGWPHSGWCHISTNMDGIPSVCAWKEHSYLWILPHTCDTLHPWGQKCLVIKFFLCHHFSQ